MEAAQRVLEKLRDSTASATPAQITEIKLAVAGVQFATHEGNQDAIKQRMGVARDLLELGAFLALKVDDVVSFGRFVAQLKPFYFDLADFLPASDKAPLLLGLNLMRLLAAKELPQFHTELELLPPSIRNSDYIAFPHSSERYLSEGAYNKALKPQASGPPDALYLPFINRLADTIRGEVADCMERGFEPIAVDDAARLLNLGDASAVADFAAQRKWVVADGKITFKAEAEVSFKDSDTAFTLIRQSLQYANEMEKIV